MVRLDDQAVFTVRTGMLVLLARSSGRMLVWPGARCWIRTNAIPVSVARARAAPRMPPGRRRKRRCRQWETTERQQTVRQAAPDRPSAKARRPLRHPARPCRLRALSRRMTFGRRHVYLPIALHRGRLCSRAPSRGLNWHRIPRRCTIRHAAVVQLASALARTSDRSGTILLPPGTGCPSATPSPQSDPAQPG